MIGFKPSETACRATLRLCSRRADGAALTEWEENDRAAHLAVCAACRQKDAALMAQSALLRSMASSSQSPLAEGAIVARAVSSWRAEQARSQALGFPARFDKRFAFGLAAIVAIAGTGTAARLAISKRYGTEKIAQAQNVPLCIPDANLRVVTSAASGVAVSDPSTFATHHSFIAGVSLRPRKQPITPVPVAITPQTRHRGWFSGLLILPPPHQARRVKPGPSPNGSVAVPEITTTATGDDMAYLNGAPSQSAAFAGRWLHLTPDAAQNLQAEIEKTIRTGDAFVDVPFPRLASTNGYDATTENAIARYRQEREIVDARLQRKITLGKKRVSFADLCTHLEAQTGISFAANKSVADDKITVFCTDRPLRDVLREIAALFNFTWQRSGEEGAYQYRLTQPLRAQLVEEELRNHDRNEALVALDKEMEKYKALTHLSPDEAKERALSATDPAEKKLYENLAGAGWGPVRLYAGLSQDQLAALRDGQTLEFAAGGEGSGALAESTATGILQSLGSTIRVSDDSLPVGDTLARKRAALPPASIPGAIASARLQLVADELGQFTLNGSSGFSVQKKGSAASGTFRKHLATSRTPSSQNPQNRSVNAVLKSKPEWQKMSAFTATGNNKKAREKITTADILEAIHKSTGQDVIGDYYTRIYDPEIISATSPRPLFDLLCDVSDKARLRWGSEEKWLTFRSASFFNDRPKEVPNRLLEHWASARQANHDTLPPEIILEIARLSDGQLAASAMAEGAKALYGLAEWDVARSARLREGWRLLASLSKNQQKAVLNGMALRFDQLSPNQQERFAAQALSQRDLASIALRQATGQATEADSRSPAEKLATATLQVEYEAPQAPAKKNAASQAPIVRFNYRFGPEMSARITVLTP